MQLFCEYIPIIYIVVYCYNLANEKNSLNDNDCRKKRINKTILESALIHDKQLD
jgi:hypothetical protein